LLEFVSLVSAAPRAAFFGFVLLYGPMLCRQQPVWAGRE